MTTQGRTPFDRILPGLFDELADARTPDYLEAAIERASSRRQRPAWWHPGWWLPAPAIAQGTSIVPRFPLRVALGVALLILALAATALLVGGQQRRLPKPFGPAANGVVALAKDGDILVADRPDGVFRPLISGPEDDDSPLFSPDGTKLAFIRSLDAQHNESALMLADADGTNIIQVGTEASLGADARSDWTFAPDGRSLMTVAQIGNEKRIVIRPVDPTAAHMVLDIPMPRTWMEVSWAVPRYRPTNAGELLIVTQLVLDGPRGIYVYDLATGAIRTIAEQAADEYVQDVAWLPDGEHITYRLGLGASRVVSADGSGDRVLDALDADHLSPFSNDGTRMVIDVAVTDVPGDDNLQRSVVVPIDGEGERVELACGLGMPIGCAWSWIWSPDDSMLIGEVPHEDASTYVLADPVSGEVTELDWVDVGAPAWQRVAP